MQQDRSGVPDTVLVYNTPTEYYTDVNQNLGLYLRGVPWSAGSVIHY